MLPLVTNQISSATASGRVQRVDSDFFKAASNFIPPVAENSPVQDNKNNTTSQQRLVASSTAFLAQLIGQNDNGSESQQSLNFSLVKYMPSFAAYPSNNNEQLELFPEEAAAPVFDDAVSNAAASATYSQTEESSTPQAANKISSII